MVRRDDHAAALGHVFLPAPPPPKSRSYECQNGDDGEPPPSTRVRIRHGLFLPPGVSPSLTPAPHSVEPDMDEISWSLIVPVKGLTLAKSRLAAAAGEHREALVLAMACDTVAAALDCSLVGSVLAVTDDPRLAAE